MTISERLSELIRSNNIVRKDLAAQISVSPSTLQTWLERGEDFPARYVVPLCNALGVAADYLLSGVEVPLPDIPDDYVKLTGDERFLLETIRGLDREGVVVVTSKAIEEARRIRSIQGSGVDGRVG